MFDVRVLKNDDCPEDIFRFRYRVYIEEMRRRQSYVDHENRLIVDPMDKTAFQGVGYYGSKLAAVIRLNFVRDGGVDSYLEFLRDGRFVP